MAQWISNNQLPAPRWYADAYRRVAGRMGVDLYRSRNREVNEDTVVTAYSFLGLIPTNMPAEEWSNASINSRFISRSIPRGTENDDNATTELLDTIKYYVHPTRKHPFLFFTINSSTNATVETVLWEKLSTEETYSTFITENPTITNMHIEELNVRTMVTVAPNHRIKMYKYVIDYVDNTTTTVYITITSIYNSNIIFKTAGATALDLNRIPELNPALPSGILQGDAQLVYSALEEYYAEYERIARENAIKTALNDLENTLVCSQLTTLEDKVCRHENNVNDLYNALRQAINELNEAKAALALKYVQNDSQAITDLKQFLTSCIDSIEYVNVSRNHLRLVYNTPLLYWNDDQFNMYDTSTRDNVITNAPSERRQMYRDIFKDKTIELRVSSGVDLDLTTGDLNYKEPRELLNHNFTELNGIPNPHHKYYNCWGDNAVHVIQAIQDTNYVGAILQIFAAIAGLNLTDTAVLTRLDTHELYDYRRVKCLKIKETGEVISIEEYNRRYQNNVSN